ncbi:MAG: elongation factor 1-beta [Nanoarchaeota archaeon]
MASVVVSIRIMPESPDTDMKTLQQDVEKVVMASGSLSVKSEVKPFAFGLNALTILFVIDEKQGDTEELEKQLQGIDGVQGVEVTDVRRTFG